MKKLSIKIIFCFLLSCSFLLSSCLKQVYDAPPDKSGLDPELTVTLSIAEIQQFTHGIAIANDDIIAGVVVMDDKSGNYFKKIVIQDNSGGIEIAIDQSYLYNEYPIGRKVYVRVKGLFLSNSDGNLMLGYTPDATGAIAPIPFSIINNYVVKATFPTAYKVDTLTISQLRDLNFSKKYLNTIVAIRDVEFTNESAGVPYAQIASLASNTNLTIEDCDKNTIYLRNSGYSKFQPYFTPTGKGMLTALFTVYNTTPQLFIRDTTDVHFDSERCEGSPLTGPSITLFSDDFSDGIINKPINWIGGYNIQEAGTVFYYYSGTINKYAKISAYVTGQGEVKSWLVTSQIDLSRIVYPKLQLKTAYSALDDAQFKAFVSTDFDGTNLTTAHWLALPKIITPDQSAWIFNQQEINLDQWIGQKIYIGFKYYGGYVGTATFGLDDVKVVANEP